MRGITQWTINLKEGIGDVIFSHDGSQILVAELATIKVYSSRDGTLIKALTGHKDRILCLAYSHDGKRFASGSIDRNVIIWTSKLEGLVKFAHNEGIRCIQFNPVTNQLVSCASSDFGFWATDGRQVPKTKVTSGIIACCWSSDGHLLALSLEPNIISLRNRSGAEQTRIERHEQPLVLSMVFSPDKNGDSGCLTVIDWQQNLSFYDSSGKQVRRLLVTLRRKVTRRLQSGKSKSLGYDPLSVDFQSNGDFLLVGGSNKIANIYTRDGVFVESLGQMTSWVTSCKFCRKSNNIVLASQSGQVSVIEITVSTVHSLYREHYAYRDSMTDVIIQNLITEEKVRIKCRDLIKKLAIYKTNLAIQLSDKTVVYEQLQSPSGMHYRVKEKINQQLDCTLLVVGSSHLVLCTDKKLQCLNFRGVIEREWTMDSLIRYIRATGGPSSREGILIGLKNGHILQIFIDNPLPVSILQTSNAIRCLDMSTERKKLALVDEHGDCYVYDVKTKEFLYQVNENHTANAVAWNTHFEDMLCFTGGGNLWVKTSNFSSFHQHLKGFVVGFCGTKIFCLQQNSVLTLEVSQTSSMRYYLRQKSLSEAYRVACLRVTDHDWDQLAFAALDNLDIEIAKKCLSRTSNFLLLDLITRYQESPGTSRTAELSFRGDVLAYRSQLNEASKMYKQAGHEDKAVNMFTDMRMFDQAQEMIRAGDSQFKKSLTMRKADWVNNINEPRAAAEMYLSAGETARAIEIMGQHGWVDMIMTTVQQLDRGDHENLTLCAEFLVKHKQYFNACEVYKKIGDVQKLAEIYVKSFQWEEAFNLVTLYPDLKEQVYVPYATWLAENDRFLEAQQAFHKAGRLDEAVRVVQQLTQNSITEHRFEDAGHYCWVLSRQCLEAGGQEDKVRSLERLADVYFTYHKIYRSIEDPFTPFFSDNLFNMARYLFHIVPKQVPEGVSMVYILQTLAKQGRSQGAHKLSRLVYDRLHSYHIPPKLRTQIQMGELTSRSKPFNDAEELLPLCCRCSKLNPLHNPVGFQCINCKEPFICSMTSYGMSMMTSTTNLPLPDVLPIVEFQLEDGIGADEAIRLVGSDSKQEQPELDKGGSRWEEDTNQTFQTLQLNDYDSEPADESSDPFTVKLTSIDEGEYIYKPITVGRAALRKLKQSEVFVAKDISGTKFYRDFLNEQSHSMCSDCHKFFTRDEWEHHILGESRCPYCRSPGKLRESVY